MKNLNILYDGESNENLKYFYMKVSLVETLNNFIRWWVKWKL